jgi:hypothetical protein
MNGCPFPLMLSSVLPRIVCSMAFGQSFPPSQCGRLWMAAAQLGPQLALVSSCLQAHWPGGKAAVISRVKIKPVATQASQAAWEGWKIQTMCSWCDRLSISGVFCLQRWDEILSNQA